MTPVYRDNTWVVDPNKWGKNCIGSHFANHSLSLGSEPPEEIIIAEGTEIIELSAFRNVCTIKSIVFPSSLRVIKSYSFSSIEALEKIDMTRILQIKIDPTAFAGCSITEENILLPYYMDEDEQKSIRDTILHPDVPRVTLSSSSIKGHEFVITGTFPLVRSRIEDRIIRYGGQVSSSVRKSTNYVLVGNRPGATKLAAAKKYGITLIPTADVNAFLATC